RLTSHPARDFLPAWSPDGSKIAFTTDRDGNEEVYVMNADGSNPVNLTNNSASDVVWAGGWSPDGTRIVFQTGRTGNSELYVMNADGSDPVNLTTSHLQEKGGAWSPDGTKVVFWQDPLGDIFVINSDGTGMKDISGNSAFLDRYPHWSNGQEVLHFEPQGLLRMGPSGGR
ncbi:MAG: PD40 domain-containing protein, partial [Gemmatimonadetes bacterium]|nr:PD40 domain-containing protein [Gemmatimonadota bacterium]